MSTGTMPPSTQTWSHATNSSSKLRDALADPNVTAIEADLLMGVDQSEHGVYRIDQRVPIMSHPPDDASDLPADLFLRQVTKEVASRPGKRHLEKHIKLDFKDIESVEPTLRMFKEIDVCVEERTVFLNADVVPGPGRSAADLNMSADHFIETCMKMMSEESKGVVFSLGFKVDVVHPFGHTEEHLEDMIDVVRRHDLMNRSAGVVLAINARLLVKNMPPFEKFLEHFPSSQLLVWTASGEPPISKRKIDRIKHHFHSHGTLDRVGFDCNVADTFLGGLAYDVLLDLYGLFLFVVKILSFAYTMLLRRKDKQA